MAPGSLVNRPANAWAVIHAAGFLAGGSDANIYVNIVQC